MSTLVEPLIHCKYDALVPIKDLKPFDKNRNRHSKEQLAQLAKILVYQGIRAPIVVDDKDKVTILKGHGTVQSIALNKWEKAPVVFQKFDNEEQRYLFCQSDNAIANQAQIDVSAIHMDIQELGPFELELLGFSDFQLEPTNFEPGTEEEQGQLDEKKPVQCPNCGEQFVPKD